MARRDREDPTIALSDTEVDKLRTGTGLPALAGPAPPDEDPPAEPENADVGAALAAAAALLDLTEGTRTGELVLRRGRVEVRAVVQGGRVRRTRSNDPGMALGPYLVRTGMLDDGSLERAQHEAQERDVPLSEALQHIAGLSKDQVRQAEDAVARERVLSLFAGQAAGAGVGGRGEGLQVELAERKETGGGPLDFDPAVLAFEGLRRAAPDAAGRSLLARWGDREMRPTERLRRHRAALCAAFGLGAERLELPAGHDGRTTLLELAADAGGRAPEMAWTLWRAKLLEQAPASGPASAPVGTPAQVAVAAVHAAAAAGAGGGARPASARRAGPPPTPPPPPVPAGATSGTPAPRPAGALASPAPRRQPDPGKPLFVKADTFELEPEELEIDALEESPAPADTGHTVVGGVSPAVGGLPPSDLGLDEWLDRSAASEPRPGLPGDVPGLLKASREARDRGDHLGVLRALSAAIDVETAAQGGPRKLVPLWRDAGKEWMSRYDRYDEAVRLLRLRIAADQTDRDAVAELRQILLETGDLAGADALYEAELTRARDPKERAARLRERGRLRLERLGRLEEARGDFDAAARTLPGDEALLEGIARLYLKAAGPEGERTPAAAAALKSASLYFHRAAEALAAREKKDTTRARQLCRQALAADPDNAAALDLFARLCGEAGRWDELSSAYRAARARAKDDAERIGQHLQLAAVAERKLRRLDAAMGEYEAVLQIDPAHREAGARLRDLYKRQHAFDRLAMLLEREPALRAGTGDGGGAGGSSASPAAPAPAPGSASAGAGAAVTAA
ncbi:MAG TPA: hypothetical protein VG389_12805, partial [Myxococcota bacterium]|nr:hypothetical protein [Myxococcota bacterium]